MPSASPIRVSKSERSVRDGDRVGKGGSAGGPGRAQNQAPFPGGSINAGKDAQLDGSIGIVGMTYSIGSRRLRFVIWHEGSSIPPQAGSVTHRSDSPVRPRLARSGIEVRRLAYGYGP
jgi:hypothetical protein